MRHHVAVSLVMMLNAMFSHAASAMETTKNSIDESIDSCTVPEEIPPKTSEPASPLEFARNLNSPLADDTKDAEFEHASFWDDHGPLLQDAWEEWEEHIMQTGLSLSSSGGSDHDDDGFINPALAMALEDAIDNPSDETEATVKSFWTNSNDHQTVPKGVYAIQLLTQSGISHIRNLLDMATSSGIPTRRPNGMNRQGVIVDSDVYGAVSMKSLLNLVEEELISRVVRPVGRMLFPDRVGCDDDYEYFAFTIRYDGSDGDVDGGRRNNDNDDGTDGDYDVNVSKRDFELKEHRDASIVTLNINLNLPEEGYAGSEVYFREFPLDEPTATANNGEQDLLPRNGKNDGGTVRFSPGMAIIHLGAHRHGSLPISATTSKNSNSKRYNLVIWLFGTDGDVRIAPYEKEDQMNAVERWRGCNHTQGFSFD